MKPRAVSGALRHTGESRYPASSRRSQYFLDSGMLRNDRKVPWMLPSYVPPPPLGGGSRSSVPPPPVGGGGRGEIWCPDPRSVSERLSWQDFVYGIERLRESLKVKNVPYSPLFHMKFTERRTSFRADPVESLVGPRSVQLLHANPNQEPLSP